jgi:hypothetical protein
MSDARDESRSRETEGEIPVEPVRHPETMYDRSDLSARAVFFFLIALAIAIALIHVITWGFWLYFAHDRSTPAPRNAAIVTPTSRISPKGDPVLRFPAPRLQPDPVADLNKFQATVEQYLNSSGAGRIPVEQAIDAVAKKGLPMRPPPVLPPRAHFGSGDATPAGSGGGTEPKGNQ